MTAIRDLMVKGGGCFSKRHPGVENKAYNSENDEKGDNHNIYGSSLSMPDIGVQSLSTRVRDKNSLKKLNQQLEKVADSFGNITDIQ